MKFRNTTVIFLSLLAAMPVIEAQKARGQTVADSNTAFALNLYQQLRSEPGNLFFSPYSISTALAMTWAGARSETETQMAAVLQFGTNQPQVSSEFGQLQKDLISDGEHKGIQLSVANGLWAEKNFPFLPAFLETATGPYQAGVKQANFVSAPEVALEEINQWVERKTEGKIQDILEPGSVDQYTRLVLANAIYFKGLWAEPFQVLATTTQPFHLTSSTQIDAPLMNRTGSFKYTKGSDFQALELPYSGGELAMVILLPQQIDGCDQLESELTTSMLSNTVATMETQTVVVFLPRFTLSSKFALNTTLSNMGMTDAFVPGIADFSGMDGARDLYISAVMHKAWGEVNEEGTEAAAATTVTIGVAAVGIPAQVPVFRADHPFLFLILETRSGSMLFLGRLADPTA